MKRKPMKSKAITRINREVEDLPKRWNEVLVSSLLDSEFSTESELFIQSAFAVHSNYPSHLEAAEAILAGDAFIPMAVESMLDANDSLEEIKKFLNRAVELIDKQ